MDHTGAQRPRVLTAALVVRRVVFLLAALPLAPPLVSAPFRAAAASAAAFSAYSAATAPAAPARSAAPGPALALLSQAELPTELRAAIDVRWASGDAIYVAMGGRGVAQAPLPAVAAASAPGGPPPAPPMQLKTLIPGKDAPGGVSPVYRVAASDEYLAAAPPAFEVAWRRLGRSGQGGVVEEAFEYVQGIDVRGDRLAIVGVRADEKRNFAPDGAIAWTGSLGRRLADLRPVVFSASGPGAAAMLNCGSFGLGAVRFLADGSLLVVAGVQPGAEMFDSAGRLVRAWDTAALGIDTDCASLSHPQAARLAADYRQRLAWLNLRRTVDSILPLPEGAGLLVRTVEGAATRWTLEILHPDGSWTVSQVPLAGASAFAHLRGDARGGRLLLLLYEDGWGLRQVARPRLATAALAPAPAAR